VSALDATPSPESRGAPCRLSQWIRWSQQHGGPGRKSHYGAVARGELPASRPGGRWLYVTTADYSAWLKSCRLETAEERRARLIRAADALHREVRVL
jgi:hypothetical protein